MKFLMKPEFDREIQLLKKLNSPLSDKKFKGFIRRNAMCMWSNGVEYFYFKFSDKIISTRLTNGRYLEPIFVFMIDFDNFMNNNTSHRRRMYYSTSSIRKIYGERFCDDLVSTRKRISKIILDGKSGVNALGGVR